MTIALILQQGLSESSHSVLSAAQCKMAKNLYSGVYDMQNVFVFVFVYFRPYLSFFHFVFASVAGRAWSGYFLTAALLSTTRIVIIIIK